VRRFGFLLIGIGAIAICWSCSSCDDKKPAPPVESSTGNVGAPTPSSNLAALGVDASVLGDPIDPPAPAGDLKAELDRFVNVDTCVNERSKLDPLVGDALGAIGYETFLRDACRLLEAAKDKKRDTCDRIDSSALRTRCQSWVAMIAQTPDQCPMQFEGLVTRGRNASCVAIAAKDPRLCAGESRTVQRATCDALVNRDPAKCDTLLPTHRPLCQREVARWKSVLAAPLEGLEKLPVVKGKISLRGVSGTPDPPTPDVDLSADFARGAVVVTGRESALLGAGTQRLRVELGTLVESEAARIAASPQKKARVGVATLMESSSSAKDAKQSGKIQKLELELPGEAPIVAPPSSCDCKVTTARAATQRGGEIAIAIEGTVASAGKSYKMALDLVTFVRDVVPENAGQTRVLPPIHPVLRGDGGR
jgi:hypothetical protein